MWSLTGWTEDGDFDYDIGMVELSTETNLGWVSFGYNTAIDESWYFYSKGYPSDKPYGSMWSTSGYVSEANTNNLEFDTSDTQPGQSGSPMYYYVSSNPIIYGVHSNSASWSFLFWTEYWNQATRITGTRFSLMCDWIDDYRLGC
jgi:glutamyl endopeptidase